MKQKSTELKGEIDNTMIIDTDLITKGEAADCSSRTNGFERLSPGPGGAWVLGSGETSQEEAERAKQ